MQSRWLATVLVVGVGCGPAVADPSGESSGEMSQSASGTVGSTSSSTTTDPTVGSTLATTTIDTSDEIGTGCLDGCGRCPWEPCPHGRYCDENAECVPLPDALAQCDNPRWAVAPTLVPFDPPAVDLAFVQVDGAGGRELVGVDASGQVQVLTPMLQPWATSMLDEPVTRIFPTDLGADMGGDAFGDLFVVPADAGGVRALLGNGLGGFTQIDAIDLGAVGPVASADFDLDDNPDFAAEVHENGEPPVPSIRVALAEVGGLAQSDAIALSAPATALAAVVGSQPLDRDLVVALEDQSLLRFDSAGDGTFEPGPTSATVTSIVDLTGFVRHQTSDMQVAALGSNGTDAVLELLDEQLDPIWQWPLPQIGVPRRIAAFGDPWSFGRDILVVFGDAPVIVLIADLGSDVPCFITVEAGPAVSVALGFTYPLLALEGSSLLRLDPQ